MTLDTIKYGIVRNTNLELDNAVEAVTEALAEEGFGILTQIDVQATLKKKLDIDRPKYLILGACNPSLANNVLNAEPWAGLLLPCNVVVQEIDGGTQIAFMDPEVIQRETGNSEVFKTACDAKERLIRVANSLPGGN
ncbi:DUF302 domain-containing protein [Candidatus Lucifugimonas marina]|uniref:DUF302 domain-containing protein n=1 Tax=Candidatus Lucifugimonas marina TaxID=3038979 RepID=A0AAJ5ZB79_9CHLR|nr:DUF302 domain-containing protein [SAR202 cluster bacterium JH702]MDG0869406.1 DUF302 domain-containing protein [SAR202 cluster bacterium JH639]WFG34152.1 DUF302 domain-containing protein [SAR202 cluster bacterium JH545]WFG38079.1 DUF302 domain-containing protein [SAR202 cluster bacterium JH1073]